MMAASPAVPSSNMSLLQLLATQAPHSPASLSTANQLPAVWPSTTLSPWQLCPHICTHSYTLQLVREVRRGYFLEAGVLLLIKRLGSKTE